MHDTVSLHQSEIVTMSMATLLLVCSSVTVPGLGTLSLSSRLESGCEPRKLHGEKLSVFGAPDRSVCVTHCSLRKRGTPERVGGSRPDHHCAVSGELVI